MFEETLALIFRHFFNILSGFVFSLNIFCGKNVSLGVEMVWVEYFS
jgi:hypothetical protein